ncbi:hypothetical protein SAMN05428944_7732 [Streptomyces sp. 1222.5]|uniref:hypothetical protein n=1 Tax=unclassified Streptomyces TaxID=2593676 RepID=UPI00089CCEC1|nr:MULTISPECIES: hypothetical protein [unclassified Streptomyces]PKW05262.1 hypothetical protein BX260_0351 [Streptomyces sp. 5112.2]SED45430.1 hypothetical protein SAMN05428944_7732 [Streptomyces sp. 1222.5]
MTSPKNRGSRSARLVVAAGAALALSACATSASDDGGSGSREAEYRRVIEDPAPSPADVVEAAGAPSGVARADNGSLLLTYDAGNVEDDEGPAAFAWRIVDPDGRTVAEHAEHTDAEAARVAFEGVRGGFIRVPPGEGAGGAYALDVDGKRHKVVITETALRTRPGDILLAAPEPTLVYRPATRTLASPAGIPANGIRFAVDERGTVWSLDQPLTEEPHRVVRQRGGRTLGSIAVPKPYTGGVLAARGGTAALSLIQGDGVRGLLMTTDGGGHWRTVLGGGIPFESLKRGPEALVLEALADGRLLVGEEGGRYWLAGDRTNTVFRELRTPVRFTSLTVDGTTLYGIADATTATYDLVNGEGLWISRDGGRQWRRYRER